MKAMIISVVAGLLGSFSVVPRSPGQLQSGPLRVNPANPRYFTDDTGKAVYLTGSHTWNNLKDSGASDPPPVFDYNQYLDFLQSHHHNFFRLWTWETPRSKCGSDAIQFTEPFPWPRNGPDLANDGKPKFDLAQFNQAYFDRLRARVIAAGLRDIYVSIMLFDGFGLRFCRVPGDGHPFDGANNLNGIDPASSIFTLDNPAAMAIQQAYVRKVVDTVNDLDNVLYEIANEAGSESTGWQYEMINSLNAYQDSRPRQHPVGMTFQAADALNSTLFNSPADWISPGIASIYAVNPPASDGSKVIIADTDHLYGVGGDFHWVWRTFTRALNPIYMDPLDNDVTHEGARLAMGLTLDYADRMNLKDIIPRGDLTSTTYALANPGVEYLVYQPGSSSFKVDLAAVEGDFTVEWRNPVQGPATLAATVHGGSILGFKAPFAGPALLYLRNTNLPAEPTLAVKITTPATGTRFAAPSPAITLTATASERYGTISQVEFHDGAALLGTVPTPPYSLAWNQAASGTHTLTARATNHLAATMDSPPVTITVGAEPLLRLDSVTNEVARLLLLGDLGCSYRVEASHNLTEWGTLQNVTVSPQPAYPGGAAMIEDAQRVNYRARFYRAVATP